MKLPPKALAAVPVIAIFALCFSMACFGADAPAAPTPRVDPKKIEATLVPEKNEITLGEQISVMLVVKNNSSQSFPVLAQDDITNREANEPPDGRARNFTLVAVDEKGVELPIAPLTKESRGSIVRIGGARELVWKILPGETKTFRLWLPWRVDFKTPGTYTLTASTKLGLYNQKDSIPVTASAPLKVLPAKNPK